MRVGVIFCATNDLPANREVEKLADYEVVEVAHAVRSALEENGYQADLVNFGSTSLEALKSYDWFFNLAESTSGFPMAEDEVAEWIESLGIGFTGASSATLKACLDKGHSKFVLKQSGLNTPAWEVFHPGDPLVTALTYPLFVKPIHEDGSIGIDDHSIVHDHRTLVTKVQEVHARYKQAALVEKYIQGRDIAASILGNGSEAMVLPLSECVYRRRSWPKILTFESKWVPGTKDYQASDFTCPCVLEPEVQDLIAAMALKAYHVMGCREYARVDFRLSGKTPYILEINPNPCINPRESGFVMSSEVAGFSYPELIARILVDSLKTRHPATNLSQKVGI